jgi:hypothetical protein
MVEGDPSPAVRRPGALAEQEDPMSSERLVRASAVLLVAALFGCGAAVTSESTAAAQAGCEGCHGFPPPAPHPLNAACQRCHPAILDDDGLVVPDATTHMDGEVELGAPPGGGGGGATACTSFTYSAFGPCVNGTQTRTVLTSSPAGCTGGDPVLAQPCGGGGTTCPNPPVAPTCVACHGLPPPTPHPQDASCHACHGATVDASNAILTAGGQHADGGVDLVPPTDGCTGSITPGGGNGGTTCNSFTYSAFGACVDGTQARTVLSSSPAGCTGGDPVLSQPCDGGGTTCPDPPVAPTCTACHGLPPPPGHPQNANCHACHATVADPDNALVPAGPHADGRANFAPATDGCTGSIGPAGGATCTSFTYSAFGACTSGTQARTVLTSSPAGCTGGDPVLTQACTSTPPGSGGGGATGCATCHGFPPPTGEHPMHVENQGIQCETCHADAPHQDGTPDVTLSVWNPSTRTCDRTCHGSRSWDGAGGGGWSDSGGGWGDSGGGWSGGGGGW